MGHGFDCGDGSCIDWLYITTELENKQHVILYQTHMISYYDVMKYL